MMEEFKKIFLLGIGAASITYEKSMEIINDMVKKGKLTLEEGKQIGDELRKTMKEKASIINDNNKKYLTKEEVLKIIAEYKNWIWFIKRKGSWTRRGNKTHKVNL